MLATTRMVEKVLAGTDEVNHLREFVGNLSFRCSVSPETSAECVAFDFRYRSSLNEYRLSGNDEEEAKYVSFGNSR